MFPYREEDVVAASVGVMAVHLASHSCSMEEQACLERTAGLAHGRGSPQRPLGWVQIPWCRPGPNLLKAVAAVRHAMEQLNH